MSNVPADLKYTKEHEWVRDNGDGSVTVGITDHAQELLGDLVFVDLPEVGASLETGGDCGVVESVKAASDVYSPLDGAVTEVNESLGDAPEIINSEPYDGGWIYKMSPSDAGQLDGLLDAAAYEQLLADEEG